MQETQDVWKSAVIPKVPKKPVVKPFIKPEQNIETVEKPAVTSEKPKPVDRSHSQGSGNHNTNKESFKQKTEKNSNRNSAGENFAEKSGGINQEKTFRTSDSLLENKGTNNGRVSYQQSEKDLTKKLQDAYKNNSKCLVFSNVKSFKSVFSELYCYDSLLKKLEINEFSNMINRNYKDNEVYIIDGLWMRYIIKFND